MIIITGPGRSGTSVLAQFCLKMGYNPGGSWYDCVDAGMEHPRVAAINDALFLEVTRTGAVQKALDEHREEMRSLDLIVVKDPRFTFHPAILRAWHSVRSDLKVLVTYRTPEHSIASRQRHARDLVHKHKRHPDVLRCDFANVIEAMLDLDIPFSILLFPNFLKQYPHVYEAFEILGMPLHHDAGQEVWNTLVNLEKVHVRSDTPGEGASAAKARPAPQKNLPTRAVLESFGVRPSFAMAFLLCLLCAPIGWKTLGATALPPSTPSQSLESHAHQFVTPPFPFTGRRFRRLPGRAPFDAAFIRGLAAYSIHPLPFATFPHRPLPWRRGLRSLRPPNG